MNEGDTTKKEVVALRIAALEAEMLSPTFWQNKDEAQQKIKELNDLKNEAEGGGKYDKLAAVLTIFSGAGGDDAEDFSALLYGMYRKFAEKRGWDIFIIHKHENDRGGYRNISFELQGKGAYGVLKNESGVHRLVRLSPFNAKALRHTSFSLVEVTPKFDKEKERDIDIPEKDLRIEFSRSSGPGGQNVNKRETAVRIVHIPTNLAVHVDTERSQQQNRDQALAILRGKLYYKMEEDRKKQEKGLFVSQTVEAEWGNQIRSYVLHPYKLVKDHRTGVEARDPDAVLSGDIEVFLDAEKNL